MTIETGKHRARILLVEDSSADVELLRRAMLAAKLDCELTILEDGAEALAFLQKVKSQPETLPPDLIILDLNLPKNDGVEVLQAMRSSGVLSQAHVAVLSSSPSFRERARIEHLGIDRYITKPADLDEFLRIGFILKELLGEGGTTPS